MGERTRFNSTMMNAVSLLLVLFAVAASAEDEVARKPKLFFVSTSATTSTLQTLSICYVSSNAISACTGRKRRAINIDGGSSLTDTASVELEPSQREQEASAPAIDGSRDGRFLLYWINHLHLHIHLLHHHVLRQQCPLHCSWIQPLWIDQKQPNMYLLSSIFWIVLLVLQRI